MSRFSARWLEIALEQYAALPLEAQRQVDARVAELMEQPEGPRGAYDEPSDQWTTTYGGGAGLMVYAVVVEYRRVLILRLV
jgi:hypothetical protein